VKDNNKIFVIAEAGVNHNGSIDMALKLVDAAKAAHADAVKFQTFKAQNLVTSSAAKAIYQQRTTDSNESQYTMLKRLELSYESHQTIINYCKKVGIEFLSTAFDLESLDFLVNDLDLRILKVPSGEITNGPLLLAHARTGCELIISTGMTTLEEIEEALGIIAFGLINGQNLDEVPSSEAFRKAFSSEEGKSHLKSKVVLLHCTTEYPAPVKDINLNAMRTMRDTFGLDVGYSDHSEGFTVSIAATALNAKIIEKHFTLDKNLEGPDHKASLEPEELRQMIIEIRTAELALGDGVKVPQSSEMGNRLIARKSLVAASNIKKGDVFTEKNLTTKRPGSGKSPMEYWNMLGKTAGKDIFSDEIIQ
jgi:N-acetylneuraminate synthase